MIVVQEKRIEENASYAIKRLIHMSFLLNKE